MDFCGNFTESAQATIPYEFENVTFKMIGISYREMG